MEPLGLAESPFKFLLDEIRGTLNAGFFFAPVSLALSLPDICSAMETDIANSPLDTCKRYQEWCEEYAQSKFREVKSLDIWALRCGVVHNAMLSKGKKNSRGRIIFMPPNKALKLKEMLIKNCGNPPENGLQISIPFFVDQLIDAAADWWFQKQFDPMVIGNLPHLVRYRLDGFAPFIGGVPVIA